MKKILVVGLGTTGCEMAVEFWKVWKMSNLFVPQNNKENSEKEVNEVDVDLRLIDTSVNDIKILLKNLKYYKTILTKTQNQIKACVYITDKDKINDFNKWLKENDVKEFLVRTACFYFKDDLVKDELWYHGKTAAEKLGDNGVSKYRRVGRQVIRQVLYEEGNNIFSSEDELIKYEAVYICTSGGGGTGSGGIFELVNWLRFRLKTATTIHILYSMVTDYNSDLRNPDNAISRTNSIMALMDLFSGASTENITSPYCDIKEFFFDSPSSPARISNLDIEKYFKNQRIIIILIDQDKDKNEYDFYLITILYLLRQIFGIKRGRFLEKKIGGKQSNPTYIDEIHSGLYCTEITDIKIGIVPIIQTLFRVVLRYVCIYQILHEAIEKEEVKELKKDFLNKLIDIAKYRKKTKEFFKKLYEDVESEKLEALSYRNIVRLIKSYEKITKYYKEFFTAQRSLFPVNNKDNQQIKELSDKEKLLNEIENFMESREVLNYWNKEQNKEEPEAEIKIKIEMIKNKFVEDIKVLCTFLGLFSERKKSSNILDSDTEIKEKKENIKSKLKEIPDGVFNILWDILTNKDNKSNLNELISIIIKKKELKELEEKLDRLAQSMIKNKDVNISSLVKICGIKWGRFIKENLYEYLHKNTKTDLDYDLLQISFDQKESYKEYKGQLYSFYGSKSAPLYGEYQKGEILNNEEWEKTSLGFFQFTLKYYRGLSLTSQPLNRRENFLISFLNESFRKTIEQDIEIIKACSSAIIDDLICSYWPINLYFFLLSQIDHKKYGELLKLWSLYDNSLYELYKNNDNIKITLPNIISKYKELTKIDIGMDLSLDNKKKELILNYLKYMREKIQYFTVGDFEKFLIISDFSSITEKENFYKIDNFRNLKEDDYTILFSLLSDKPETCKILRWYNIFLLQKALILKDSGLLEE